MWTQVHRIPGVMFGVPAVKAIVMIGDSDEQLRAGPLEAVDKRLGLPFKQRPLGAKFFVAESRGVAEVLQVVLVLIGAFHVHVARIPVSGFWNALRGPVSPDSELRIAIPFRGEPKMACDLSCKNPRLSL